MKNFGLITIGMALLSGGAAMAGERYAGHHEIFRDEVAISRQRADMERDRCRLNDDIRDGRRLEAARQAADLARDRRQMQERLHDVRHDRNDLYRDNHRG